VIYNSNGGHRHFHNNISLLPHTEMRKKRKVSRFPFELSIKWQLFLLRNGVGLGLPLHAGFVDFVLGDLVLDLDVHGSPL